MIRSLTLLLALFVAPAWGQSLIDCATGVPCALTGPFNTTTGDQLPVGAGKINADLNILAPLFLTGLPSNEFLATPCSGSGGFEWRVLCAADLPAITGDFSITGGVGTINAGVVTNAKLAQANAFTLKGNCTSSTATVQDCTISQILAMLGSATGDPQLVEICVLSGIDPTGVADSRASVVTAFNTIAGSTAVLEVNCPVRIAIGLDYTKPVFIASNTAVKFGPTGQFNIDNVGPPAFIMENAHDITLDSWKIFYQGNFGIAGGINYAVAPLLNVTNNANDVTIKNYLVSTGANTFGSGGSALWAGNTNMWSTFQIRGNSYRINFIGKSRAYVADNATAGQFNPLVFSFAAEWNAGLTGITNSTVATTANTTIPHDIVIHDWDLDGYYMGFLGQANVDFANITAHRYSDCQDGTNGTVTFSGTLSSGATSATLSTSVYPTGWSYPSGSYDLAVPLTGAATTAASGSGGTVTITFGGGATIPVGTVVAIAGVAPTSYNGTFTVTSSSAGSVSFPSSATGAQTVAGTVAQVVAVQINQGATTTGTFSHALVAASASAIAVSGNVGGISFSCAPPHLFYLLSGDTINYKVSEKITNVIDYGQYVGFATRRATGSGSMVSMKVEPANNTVVDGYISLRPDGCADVLAYGNSNGAIRNFYCVWNSSLSTQDGSNSVWGWRYPNADAFTNLSIDNLTLIDTATVPTQFAMQPLGVAGNSGVSLTNIKAYENDWPSAATYYPGFSMAGSNNSLQGEIFFAACNSITKFRGSFDNQGTTTATDTTVDLKIHGWRQFTVNFTAPLASGATTGTLSAGWAPESGTYKVTFSDGDIRLVAFTNGSTTVGAWTALTAASTAVANAGNALVVDHTSYKNLVVIGQGGKATGNHVTITDTSNGFVSVADGTLTTEYWTQEYFGTPTGSSVTTQILFPASFAIDRVGWAVTTNLSTANGLTGVGVGWAGSPIALISNANITTNNVGLPITAPQVSPGTAIILTPTGGTFGTTGNFELSVRGVSMFGTL